MRSLLATLLLLAPCASSAHGWTPPPGFDDGVKLPALSHGEMAVVARYRGAILALADRQATTDPEFRRIGNFTALQHAFCLWGVVPGSIGDEASPFNECSHADLAGVRALLVHMAHMPAARTDAAALDARLQRDLAAGPPEFCRYSEEPFSTAFVIFPDWTGIPRDPPALLTLAALLLCLRAATLMLGRAIRPAACYHQARWS